MSEPLALPGHSKIAGFPARGSSTTRGWARWRRLLLVVALVAVLLGVGGHLLLRSAGIAVDVPGLTESSGLAASHRNPDVLWSHNDSGTQAELFAFTTAGEPVATLTLRGADPTDWEDIAIGPDAAGTPFAALYLGDIGDNAHERESVQVYRVSEPDLTGVPPGEPVELVAEVERFTFHYADGARDAETLMVDPRDGSVLVLEKAGGDRVGLYRSDLIGDPADLTLERVADIGIPGLIGLTRLVTGGAVSPAGDLVVVRTYLAAWYWPVGPDESVADAMAEEPQRLGLPVMRQGEAITFSADGQLLYLTSEGEPAPLASVPAPEPGGAN